MKLEELTTTLDQSKRIKELWYKWESIFEWRNNGRSRWVEQWWEGGERTHPALTASEIMDLLPEDIADDYYFEHLIVNREHEVGFYTCDWSYKIPYANDTSTSTVLCTFRNQNFVHCLGDMLIYLVEKKIIEF